MKTNGHVSNTDYCHLNRAAAVNTPYLLESNIKLLPGDTIPNCLAATDLLGNEKKRARLIGENAMLHYQRCPLSCAVDGNTATAFRSPYSESKDLIRTPTLFKWSTDAKQGDYILIDVLSMFEFDDSTVELVFLVTEDNEQILRRSKYECSSDGKRWVGMAVAQRMRDAEV